MTRFWNDEVYGQFYQSSTAERGLINKGPPGGQADKREASQAGDFWQPTRQQLDKFQGSFAEWSQGRGVLRETDFRHFLLDVGVELSVAQARCLWQEAAPSECTSSFSYENALLAYRKVMEAPVQFKASKGAAPPGMPLEEAPLTIAEAEISFDEVLEKRATSKGAGLGPGLPLSEAADFLLEEGIAQTRVEALLKRFSSQGAVPQAVLFELLEEPSEGLG